MGGIVFFKLNLYITNQQPKTADFFVPLSGTLLRFQPKQHPGRDEITDWQNILPVLLDIAL
jgi:hypothetical protein